MLFSHSNKPYHRKEIPDYKAGSEEGYQREHCWGPVQFGQSPHIRAGESWTIQNQQRRVQPRHWGSSFFAIERLNNGWVIKGNRCRSESLSRSSVKHNWRHWSKISEVHIWWWNQPYRAMPPIHGKSKYQTIRLKHLANHNNDLWYYIRVSSSLILKLSFEGYHLSYETYWPSSLCRRSTYPKQGQVVYHRLSMK